MSLIFHEISKATFKHIEAEWYKYPQTVKEIQRLRYNIIQSSTVDENVGGGRSGMISKPTEIAATRLTTHKQLDYLEDIVYAIETVYNLSNDQYKRLVQIRYWNKRNLNWDQIAGELGYSRGHAIRIRNHMITDTAELLGWR